MLLSLLLIFYNLERKSVDEEHQDDRIDDINSMVSSNAQNNGNMSTLGKDLFKCIDEVQKAIDLFFDNKFVEAKELTEQK